jgi:hypothetical protein
MSVANLARLSTARELREKAERYRNLALFMSDKRAIEIILTTSRELDEKAREIEGEVARGVGCRSMGAGATPQIDAECMDLVG